MMMGRKEERERKKYGRRGNDCRHRKELSSAMVPPTMKSSTTARGGHELERQKGKKNEMTNKENERKERRKREDEGKGR